jgi:hypothetical protein
MISWYTQHANNDFVVQRISNRYVLNADFRAVGRLLKAAKKDFQSFIKLILKHIIGMRKLLYYVLITYLFGIRAEKRNFICLVR